jgi:hypothetical protein
MPSSAKAGAATIVAIKTIFFIRSPVVEGLLTA